VLSYVRDRIVTGKFAPGTRLNESEIAAHLDISRHPLREALRRLESEYLVVSTPRRGCYVRELSQEDFRGLTDTREMIECFAIDILKGKKVRKIKDVEKSLEAEANASLPSRDDVGEMLAYHGRFVDFHIKLIESTENYRLIDFYGSINTNLARYQLIYLCMPNSVLRSVEDHKNIIEHISVGDYGNAKELMRRHIYRTYEFLVGKLFPDVDQTDQLNQPTCISVE
jgi:DNA-binding GntR family transcriptional regulator